MSFDVSFAHEARWIRITVRGDPRLGRLLSLLQVLEVDSPSWQRDAVLLDLREVQTRLSQQEQLRLAQQAAHALRRQRRVALLAAPGALREAAGVRVFADEAAARDWFAQD